MRSLLREFIRDSILLEKKKDCHGDVCIAVSALKSSLQKKHFVVQVVYKQPDPSNRHANFGSLDVRIDAERGRGSNMTQSATAKAIRGAVDSSDVGKFFRTNGATFDGSWVNVGFLLRDKYASDYMQGKKPEESGEDKEADKKSEEPPKADKKEKKSKDKKKKQPPAKKVRQEQ